MYVCMYGHIYLWSFLLVLLLKIGISSVDGDMGEKEPSSRIVGIVI